MHAKFARHTRGVHVATHVRHECGTCAAIHATRLCYALHSPKSTHPHRSTDTGQRLSILHGHDGTSGCTCEVDDRDPGVVGDTDGCGVAGHSGPICCIQFAPDGAQLASSSSDGTCIVWCHSRPDVDRS